MTNKDLFDLTVIGGGPAGLYTAFYAGLRELKTKIIEADQKLGGKLHIYPQKMIWDVGGMTPITGRELMNQSIEQGLTFKPDVALNQIVINIEKTSDGYFLLQTTTGEVHYSKAVVIATGKGGIIRSVKLEIPQAAKYETSNLHYEVYDVNDFRNKSLLISGGGPTSIDWGNDLSPVAKDITLIYRGDELKGLEAIRTKLDKNGVNILYNTEIHELKGDKDITEIVLYNNKKDELFSVSTDAVLVNHGFHKENRLFDHHIIPLNIELDDHLLVKSDAYGSTNIPGIYGVGDCVNYEGKLKLIAGVYQDACNAVNRAKVYLDPNARRTAMVSSHHDLLDERSTKILSEMNQYSNSKSS